MQPRAGRVVAWTGPGRFTPQGRPVGARATGLDGMHALECRYTRLWVVRRLLLRDAAQLPIEYERPQHVHDHTRGEQSGHVGYIVRR